MKKELQKFIFLGCICICNCLGLGLHLYLYLHLYLFLYFVMRMKMIVGPSSPNQSPSKEASGRKSVRKLIFLGCRKKILPQKDEKCVLFEKRRRRRHYLLRRDQQDNKFLSVDPYTRILKHLKKRMKTLFKSCLANDADC